MTKAKEALEDLQRVICEDTAAEWFKHYSNSEKSIVYKALELLDRVQRGRVDVKNITCHEDLNEDGLIIYNFAKNELAKEYILIERKDYDRE